MRRHSDFKLVKEVSSEKFVTLIGIILADLSPLKTVDAPVRTRNASDEIEFDLSRNLRA
jgi:hypothetical protein